MTRISKKKIAVFTGTRAEYGLLSYLMHEIQKHSSLELVTWVSGSHLSHDFGSTVRFIESDGFAIDAKIPILKEGVAHDSPYEISCAMARATEGVALAIQKSKPDCLVLLGDRYEAFSAAAAATVMRTPIAHLHGGETTEGAIDDAFRHSITQMADFHFVAAPPYAERVRAMGKPSDRVFCFGAIGLDAWVQVKRLSRGDFLKSVGLTPDQKFLLVTYHPVTKPLTQVENPLAGFDEICKALDQAMSRDKNLSVLWTHSNADVGGKVLNEKIIAYAKKNPARIKEIASLGQVKYLSALEHCELVLGNSSSGIIEAPFVSKPTVDVGDRQKGRLRAASVISVFENAREIEAAIAEASSSRFAESIRGQVNPYGPHGTEPVAKRIADTLHLLV